MTRIITIITLCSFLSLHAQGHELIFASKAATALNTVTLFQDTSLTKHSNIVYQKGALFEVLGESHFEHEDAAQNQKFKWYNVKTADGKTGWVFGDAVAVILAENELDTAVSSFHKKRFMFNNGFEKAVVWIAALQGRDNFHQQDYLNPLYKEYYLVVTNEKGESVQINFAGESATGKSSLHKMQMTDLTGDKIPEFIFQKNNWPTGSEIENRDLLIYSFQAGTLVKVFEERLTLQYDAKLTSPALYKSIEIEGSGIRVEYIDYLSCDEYEQGLETDNRTTGSEKCMEYVTYSFQWDDRSSSYYKIYEESRTPVSASMRFNGIFLKSAPTLTGGNIRIIQRTEPLKVVKHYETFRKTGAEKKVMDNYLYVVLPDGQQGYVSANKVVFSNTDHAEVLLEYYYQAPLHKNSWKSEEGFVKVLGDGDTSARRR
ncbi:MAG: hypothetical protein AB8F74_18725 [Saprospiraceae bacterium]